MNIYIGYCACVRAWYVARRLPGQNKDFYLHDDGQWRDSTARWIWFKGERVWVFAPTGFFQDEKSARYATVQAGYGELIGAGAR